MTIPVPAYVQPILAAIREAADNGAACPTNAVLCGLTGASSLSTASSAVSLLEAMGIITVERGRSFRVVTITATGKRTAGRIKKPIANYNAPKQGEREHRWTETDDNLLMERVAEGDDFEQAGARIGVSGNRASARFDYLAARMGAQAA